MSDGARVLPAVELNEQITKAVQAAISVDDIKAALIAEAESQAAAANQTAAEKAAADKAAADKAAAEAAASSNQLFKRTEIINGHELDFEAPTELELERLVLNAYKVANAVRPTEAIEPHVDPAVAAATAKAAEEADIAAKAELEGRWKRGEISAAEYIEQSGAVESFLSKRGVSLDKLQETVEANQSKKFEQSWAEATEEFLQGAGADWPGGDRNREMIGLKIAQLGLVDAEDKVQALAKAFNEMKRTNMVFENDGSQVVTPVTPAVNGEKTVFSKEELEAAVAAAAQKAVQDAIAASRPARTAATSSSMFDRSSGISSSGTPSSPAEKISADKAAALKAAEGANPQEILEAWKAAQVANGVDPNAAFVQTFQAKRV